ncbi:MAG: response regulator [Pseudoxanthomonas sp.]
MRCLVVEDDADIRADLARALQAAGFVVDECGDGESAWFQGDIEGYGAAILDLGLPRLDGLSVLRHWRDSAGAVPAGWPACQPDLGRWRMSIRVVWQGCNRAPYFHCCLHNRRYGALGNEDILNVEQNRWGDNVVFATKNPRTAIAAPRSRPGRRFRCAGCAGPGAGR